MNTARVVSAKAYQRREDESTSIKELRYGGLVRDIRTPKFSIYHSEVERTEFWQFWMHMGVEV